MESSVETIQITEFLKDYIIAEEKKSVILDCKLNIELEGRDLSGCWFKDSNLIISCNTVIISSRGLWQSLELKNITKADEGIYWYLLKAPTGDVCTKCELYVKPFIYNNNTRIFNKRIEESVRVETHLRNCIIEEGGRFTLTAVFSANIKTCMWYKYTIPANGKYPKFIMQQENTSTTKLFLDNAEKADSGIYSIVAETHNNKYLCSYCDVIVSNDYVNALNNNVRIPHIWQSPEDLVEVYDKDDVTFLFKVTYDINTVIEWTKDGEVVKFNNRIIRETYDNKYIALKLFDVDCSDSGRYNLIVRNLSTSFTEMSTGVLTVKPYPFMRPALNVVSKGLEPAIVSIGNKVTFECSFDIPIDKLTYVVWIIGCKKVEKSCKTFNVMSNANNFILNIPVVTPDMAGEVTCQLRQAVLPRQSILVCKTKAILTIVPPQVFTALSDDYEEDHNMHRDRNVLLPVTELDPHRPFMRCFYNSIILYLKFCRTSGGNFFFEPYDDHEYAEVESVGICKEAGSDFDAISTPPLNFIISWVRPDDKDWYSIELYKEREKYTEIGKTKSAQFYIENPPEDTLLKFRIRNIKPGRKRNMPAFHYVPEEISPKRRKVEKNILPYNSFKESYTYKSRISQGKFGCVDLVRRINDDLFITKTTNYLNQDEWRNAHREFEIMKSLVHPNIVTFVDGFAKRNDHGMIFTMEYLWGGELSESTIERENLTEGDVIIYVRQILLALQFLHSKNIAHLDIKPSNIMFPNRNSRRVKLINFGTARAIDEAIIFPRICESSDYAAPEMISEEPVGLAADMWSLGVITYWLLTGKYPFSGETWIERSRNICQVSYIYDEVQFRLISDRAKTFVNNLICRQPVDRMTAEQALKNNWIIYGPNEERPVKIQIPTNGGLVLIELLNKAQVRWKKMLVFLHAWIKFHRKRQSRNCLGLRQGERRYSTRLLLARQNNPPVRYN